MVDPIPISSEEHVVSFMRDVMARGGEGLIFRNPSAKYYDAASFLKLVVCLHHPIQSCSHNGIVMSWRPAKRLL